MVYCCTPIVYYYCVIVTDIGYSTDIPSPKDSDVTGMSPTVSTSVYLQR